MNQIFENICSAIEKNKEKMAIVCNDESILYFDLLMESKKLADILIEKGAKAGSHIGIFQHKSIEFVISVCAILSIDAVMIPFNIGWTEEEVHNAVEIADVSILLYDKEIRCFNCNNIYSKEDCIFLMTSGSTGVPKIVQVSWSAMLTRLKMEVEEFALFDNDVVLISTPIYHSLGIRLLLTSLYLGTQIILPKTFYSKGWLEYIEKYQITYTITVPNQIVQILKEVGGRYDEYNEKLRTLKTILSTASYLPEDVKKEFVKVIRGNFYNFIASSETEFIAKINCKKDIGDNLLGYPFAGTKLCILKDDNSIGGVGEIGEIVCSSPQLFSKYYHNDCLTENAIYDGFYRTGDMGFLDERGCVHFSGRKKNVVICCGVNIYPRDVEEMINRCDGVIECVAMGLEDKGCGEILAVVVATNCLSKKEIQKYCVEHLAVYEQPREIIIVDSIQKNDLGKINKDEIKKSICGR